MKNSSAVRCWWWCRETRSCTHCWQECKMVQTLEHDLIVPFKTKHKLTIWHSGHSLGIYPSEMTRPQKTWLMVHTSFIYSSPALYQPKCPAVGKWLNKLAHPHRERCVSSVIRRNNCWHVTVWLHRSNTTLSQRASLKRPPAPWFRL